MKSKSRLALWLGLLGVAVAIGAAVGRVSGAAHRPVVSPRESTRVKPPATTVDNQRLTSQVSATAAAEASSKFFRNIHADTSFQEHHHHHDQQQQHLQNQYYQQQQQRQSSQQFLSPSGDSLDPSSSWYSQFRPDAYSAAEDAAADAEAAKHDGILGDGSLSQAQILKQRSSSKQASGDSNISVPFESQKEANPQSGLPASSVSPPATGSVSATIERQQQKQQAAAATSIDDELRYADARDEDAIDDESDVEQLDPPAHKAGKGRDSRVIEQASAAHSDSKFRKRPQQLPSFHEQSFAQAAVGEAPREPNVTSLTRDGPSLKPPSSNFASHSGWIPAPLSTSSTGQKLSYSSPAPSHSQQTVPTDSSSVVTAGTALVSAPTQLQPQQDAEKFVEMFASDMRRPTSATSKTDAAIEYLRNILRSKQRSQSDQQQQHAASASNASNIGPLSSRLSTIASKLNQILYSGNNNATQSAFPNATNSLASTAAPAAPPATVTTAPPAAVTISQQQSKLDELPSKEAGGTQQSKFSVQKESKFTTGDVRQTSVIVESRQSHAAIQKQLQDQLISQYQTPLSTSSSVDLAGAADMDAVGSQPVAQKYPAPEAQQQISIDSSPLALNKQMYEHLGPYEQISNQQFPSGAYSNRYFQMHHVEQDRHVQQQKQEKTTEYLRPTTNAPVNEAQYQQPNQANLTMPKDYAQLSAIEEQQQDLTKTMQESKLYSNGSGVKRPSSAVKKFAYNQQQTQQHQQPQYQNQPGEQHQQQPQYHIQFQEPQQAQQQQQQYQNQKAHGQKLDAPKLFSFNQTPQESSDLGDLIATNYQLDDALYSSSGALEKQLSSAELESIRRQFLTAEHPLVELSQAAVDSHHYPQHNQQPVQVQPHGHHAHISHQAPPQQAHQRLQPQAPQSADYHHQQSKDDQSLNSLLHQFRAASGVSNEDSLKELESSEGLPSVMRPDSAHHQDNHYHHQQKSIKHSANVDASQVHAIEKSRSLNEASSVVAHSTTALSDSGSTNNPLIKLLEASSGEMHRDVKFSNSSLSASSSPIAAAVDATGKKKNLIVYLNHPRPSGIAKLRQQAAPTTDDETFVSAKEFDFNSGLSKETKQLDVSNLASIADADADGETKDGLSVVVIGDAYKYKKVILLISSKSEGLKLIPMVKDLNK